MERKYYYSKRNQAKESKRRYMSIIIDGMDQSKFMELFSLLFFFKSFLSKGPDFC